MEVLIVLLLMFVALPLIIIAYCLNRIRKILSRGEDVNRLTKSLAVTLAGLVAARVARKAVKAVLK